MPTEDEIQNFLLRFNQQVGNLNEVNQQLLFFRRFWDNLTVAQKTGLKNMVGTKIDDATTALGALRTEILGF